MKKLLAKIAMFAMVLSPFVGALPAGATTMPNWNVTGDYVVTMQYQGADYAHDMTLAQDGMGNLTGNGGYPAGGAHTYAWTVTSGTVAGDSIDLYANYTASDDAVTPQTVLHMSGTIASDGMISGTWSDNYQGGDRSGTWSTTSGTAGVLAGSIAAEDFGVVDYDTGLGSLRGYSAGFGLTDATFAHVQSVVVKLYSGATLLQTNTATAKVGTDITGAQISSPFDVSGTFDYATDGFWTNTRESEYGQTLPATKVVAMVTLENGKMVTAENTTVAGDPTTIYPPVSPNGTIGGTVTGGAGVGVLAVTSVTAVQTTATADDTFAHGWKYTFNITVPSNEQNLAMKFGNWFSAVASSTIPAANNMQISSAQADNAGAVVPITAANTYSVPALRMTGDLDSAMPGMQVQVSVEVKIPASSVNGSYTTTYGVQTLP